MKGLWSEKENYELNLLWDRKPVNLLEDRSGVIMGPRVSKEKCSRVLDVLEFTYNFE